MERTIKPADPRVVNFADEFFSSESGKKLIEVLRMNGIYYLTLGRKHTTIRDIKMNIIYQK